MKLKDQIAHDIASVSRLNADDDAMLALFEREAAIAEIHDVLSRGFDDLYGTHHAAIAPENLTRLAKFIWKELRDDPTAASSHGSCWRSDTLGHDGGSD